MGDLASPTRAPEPGDIVQPRSRRWLVDDVTPPQCEGGSARRDMRRVYDKAIAGATRALRISAYAFFNGPKALGLLARRMDAKPELTVHLLLNVQQTHRDSTTPGHIVRRFADRFWSSEWPGSRRPSVYYDPRALEEGGRGVLHAKAVVAAEVAALVTSANLTEAALDHNIELGHLVHDRLLAKR